MKAIVYYNYGSPDVLKLEDIQKPTPSDNEVLIKVHAASVNAGDWRAVRADPFFIRLGGGLLKPKNKMLAEYVCADENVLALKPASMTFEEAAAVPGAGITALRGLRDFGQIQPGQKVLINGASGGVGTFAVQIAQSFGAEVTGVCSTSKLDMVRSIGADQVIDYTQEDFTQNGQRYDLILDIGANCSLSDYKRALSPKGIYVLAGFSMAAMLRVMFLGPLFSMTGSKKFVVLMPKLDQKAMVFMKELLEAGKVVPVIDRRYPLSEVAEAIRYVEEGHARGKVVITVEHNNK